MIYMVIQVIPDHTPATRCGPTVRYGWSLTWRFMVRHKTLLSAIRRWDIPFINGLLILLIWLDKPLADADEATVHEAALQQVVDGLEEERSTLVGQAALPLAVLLTWEAGGHIKVI